MKVVHGGDGEGGNGGLEITDMVKVRMETVEMVVGELEMVESRVGSNTDFSEVKYKVVYL